MDGEMAQVIIEGQRCDSGSRDPRGLANFDIRSAYGSYVGT
jgi:hypothetical protein